MKMEGHTNSSLLENLVSWEKKDFYQRLGLSFKASEEEIRKAFKTLSIKYHPDKVNNDEKLKANYEEIQKMISEAYNTLTNQANKLKYDSRFNVNNSSHSSNYNSSYTKPEKSTNTVLTEKEQADVLDRFSKDIYEILKQLHLQDTVYKIKGNISMLQGMGISSQKIMEIITNNFTEHFTKLINLKLNPAQFTNSFLASRPSQTVPELIKAIPNLSELGVKNIITEKIAMDYFLGYIKYIKSQGGNFKSRDARDSLRFIMLLNNNIKEEDLKKILIQNML